MIYFALSNPGNQYRFTRHNAGAIVLDGLASRLGVKFEQKKKLKSFVAKVDLNRFGDHFVDRCETLILAKSDVFMNQSGDALALIINFYKSFVSSVSESNLNKKNLDNLCVVCDDLDLEFGSYKLQFGKGPKMHNGLLDCYQKLGTNQFWHLRIGIDDRMGERVIPARNYVLQNFSIPQLEALESLLDQDFLDKKL